MRPAFVPSKLNDLINLIPDRYTSQCRINLQDFQQFKNIVKKAIFVFLFLVLCVLTTDGQFLYLETGKVISSMRYKDSGGAMLEGLTGSNHNSLSFGYRMPLFKSNFHVSCGPLYNRYGAFGSNPVLGNYYEWDVTYMGANLGFDYEFYKPSVKYNKQHGFSFYPKVATAAEFLISGSQNLNDQVYDLKGEEEFDKPLYFLRGGIGINYYISKTFLVFVEYLGGSNILIGDYNGQEQLRFITHNISVGLSINLSNMNQ